MVTQAPLAVQIRLVNAPPPVAVLTAGVQVQVSVVAIPRNALGVTVMAPLATLTAFTRALALLEAVIAVGMPLLPASHSATSEVAW
ncbi:hypothetical protein D3C84_886730 [compost metagenome]